MRLVAIIGSPRKGGNTDILVSRISAGAASAGAQVETFHLNDMDIRFCQACDQCIGAVDDPCVLQDDMQALHEALRACDAFVVGTPVYWFGPSAQTKTMLDRLYALQGPDGLAPNGSALNGKRAALAMAYADADPLSSGAHAVYRMFRDAFDWVDVKLVGVVHASAGAKGEVAANQVVLEEAFALGRRLCEGGPPR